jgi:TubC N-terminal docking domain
MTTATSLVSSLRAAGISIRVERGRLLLEAPRGTITAEIRSQLASCKAELISILELEEEHRAKDPTTVEALREATALLATAYQRWRRIPRIAEVSGDPLNAELALRAGQSVHGCEL